MPADKNTMLYGSPILLDDNTVPGVKYTPALEDVIPRVIQACLEFGLDPYPPVVELLTYDDISEVAAYGGFPVRFPHWSFGMEYEELSRGYEHGMHKIYEMVVNCCDPLTWVATQRGSMAIKDVEVGDIILSRNGSRKVVAVKQQPKAPTVKFSLEEFGTDTICSQDHRWKVLRDSKPHWVKAKDLKSGDLVVAGGRYENFVGHAPVIEWTPEAVYEATLPNVRWKLKSIQVPSHLTLSTAELLGVGVGDGSHGVPTTENNIEISVGHGLDYYVKHLSELIRVSLGIDPSVYPRPRAEGKGGDFRVVINSKYAVDFFHQLGSCKGVTCESKRVPSIIWASSNEFKAAFLRGYFDTDGRVRKSLSVSSQSEHLIKDVQFLLLELGIRSKVKHVQNDSNDIWTLFVKGRMNQAKFMKYIGFSLPYKSDALSKLVNASYAIGWGFALPGVQQELVDRIGKLPHQNKLPSWIRRIVRKTNKGEYLGQNALWSFVNRVATYFDGFDDIVDTTAMPLYRVEEVSQFEERETIDVALDHDDHDFLANGLVSHNTNPSYIYCLDSNPLLDHVTVIAHATGHSDFFKNNAWFEPTTENALNELANHGSHIRRYMDKWGRERVTEFMDWVLSIDDLIDFNAAWDKRCVKELAIRDKREYHYPRRLKLPATNGVEHDYMEDWINTPNWREAERNRIARLEVTKELNIFHGTNKDILGYLVSHAPLKPWQQDIIAMLYREAQYFAPQALTKMLNEGWASYVDFNIMARRHWAKGDGIYDYARHKMGVLGGKYSMNPYAVGFKLFMHLEDKWNKGRFGREYNECNDMLKRKKWDTKAGLGHDKVFEVRKIHNDMTAIHSFVDQEFVDEHEIYVWERFPRPDGGWEYRIKTRDAAEIRSILMRRYSNGGRPDIRLVDPNFANKDIFLLEHQYDGQILARRYAQAALVHVWNIWNNGGLAGHRPVAVSTKDKDGKEFLYVCVGRKPEHNLIMTRKQFEEQFV